MTASLTLIITMAVLFGAGIFVMLERSLTRVLIGFLLVGNAVNLLIYLMTGAPGLPPILHDDVDTAEVTDALPQAFILTAIVINLGLTSFMLALIYRSWWLAQLGAKGDLVDDEADDIEEAEEAADFVRSTEADDEALQELIDASDEDYPVVSGEVLDADRDESAPDQEDSVYSAPEDERTKRGEEN